MYTQTTTSTIFNFDKLLLWVQFSFHLFNRTHSSRVGPYDDDVGYIRIARSHFIKYLCMGALAIAF